MVDVYDMGFRGPGGRASTRKYEGQQFDHGCQFLGQGVPQSFVKDLEASGVLHQWKGRFGLIDSKGHFEANGHLSATRSDFCGLSSGAALYVGMPGMSAICAHLTEASGITAHWRHQVTGLDRDTSGAWSLKAKVRQPGDAPAEHASYGPFDAVVLADTLLTKPGSPFALDSQAAEQSDVVRQMRTVTSKPATTLMVVLPSDESISFDAAVVDDPIIKWIAKDSAKPGRKASSGHTCWTVVSTSECHAC
ncbi:hypothetical protein WJX73_008470 [Symbiochloris irregularis]|uniref:Uncharacterized protein n=1 Tax=Symbiochloris irregularis TaxID=706552 RepID=A0AAW1NZY6_9CHLO